MVNLRKREATLHSDPGQDKEGSLLEWTFVSHWDKSEVGTTQKKRDRTFMWDAICHHSLYSP